MSHVRPLRVLVDASTAHPGGGLSYLAAQLPRLEQHGIRLLVVAPERVAAALAPILPNAEFRRLTGRSVRRAIEAQVRLPVLARRWRADVVYCPGSTGPVLMRAPRVLLIQNPHLFTEPAARNTRLTILRMLCWLSALSATGVVHISHAMAAEFERTSALRCPTSVAWSGPGTLAVDTAGATPRAKTGAARPPYLLTVSDLYWYKRTDLLIEAYAHDWQLRETYELVIAGSDYLGEAGRLRGIVDAAGLSEKVHFLGFVDGASLLELYAGAAAYVSLSEREAFPLTPAEALSAGAPVVLSDTPFFRELYEPWATFVAGPGREDVAEAIATAVAKGRSPEAVAAVGDRFSWERNGELIAAELRRAAGAGVPSMRARRARIERGELKTLARTVVGDAATRVV